MKLDMSEEELKNYTKNELKICASNFSYFCEKYVSVKRYFDGRNLEVPFVLEKFQRKVVKQLNNNTKNICVKFRRGGFSTMMAIYALWEILFKDNYKVLILSSRDRTAVDILKIASFALSRLPNWMVNPEEIKINNSHQIKIKNSFIISMEPMASCGVSYDHMMVDEPFSQIYLNLLMSLSN